LLATDEDREGESIAWHLLEVLKPKVPVKRMVFHEITKKAIQAALDETRELNRELVDAQEARRILDRLYGYEVSPVLWKKVMPRLSAGRVQSVATRIVVERERARIAFRRATWWGMAGQFAADGVPLDTQLSLLDGKRLATGKDFDSLGQIKGADLARPDEASIRALAQALEGRPARVESVEKKPYKRSPAAPFMTSTLQQEAGRKLRFAAKRAMRAAQRLYEGGFITYMRTDSTTLSDGAVQAARRLIADEYGADYLPAQPRRYTKKVKNAQPAIAKLGGDFGTVLAGIDMWMRTLKIGLPFTLKHTPDYTHTKRADLFDPIIYPKPDGVISFDKLTSVAYSFTNHAEDQPTHLKVKDMELQKQSELGVYAGLSQRYCPAGVYEWVEDEDTGEMTYVINGQNCVHCKTCDIKDPNQNIVWTVPEGGGGPNYPNM